MKRNIRNHWKVALAAGILTTLVVLPKARAELVYEPEVSPNAPVQVREDDREATRQALAASVKAQDTLQAQQVQQVQQVQAVQPVQQVQAQPVAQYVTQVPIQQQPRYVAQEPIAAPAPVVAPAQPVAVPVAVQVQPQVQVAPEASAPSVDSQQPQVESLSKAELMRRERMRTELQNEDLLDERLEELRLRDEKRRTQELLGDTSGTQDQPVSAIPGMSLQNQQPQAQVVVSPVTDHPGEEAPQVAPVPGAQTVASQDQIGMSQAAATSSVNASAVLPAEESKPNQFYVSPRFGTSSLNVNSNLTGVSANGQYAAGIALGTSVSDNVGFEVGYTYSTYGISLGQQYLVPTLQQYQYQFNQNVIDAMLKLYFLGPDSRIRPYVGAGGGYTMGSLTYPNQLTSLYPYLSNQSYNSNGFLGELAAGMDVKISKQVSVGAIFKYSNVFSANQNNNNLQYYGGYGYAGAVPYGVGPNAQQQLTGASLSQSSFYTVQGVLNFSF